MVTRKITISLDEYYHVYNRGVDKRIVFLDSSDKDRFVKLLYFCNNTNKVDMREIGSINLSEMSTEKIVAIGAYCLMDNHFHILLREIKENGISKFLEKVTTAYAMYFNKKYIRTGALFEGNFKIKHCDCDEYLKYIYSYIHLNPVKMIDPEWKEKGVKDLLRTQDFLRSYRYSSFLDYIKSEDSEREEILILSKVTFPEYFTDISFKENIDFWLQYRNTKGNPS